MQERSVTVQGNTMKLPEPFFVLATQNPIEQEGTYPLPEAQLDRFMFSLNIGYPGFEEEVEIVRRTTGADVKSTDKLISAQELIALQDLVRRVSVADEVVNYAVSIVRQTPSGGSRSACLCERMGKMGSGPPGIPIPYPGCKSESGDFRQICSLKRGCVPGCHARIETSVGHHFCRRGGGCRCCGNC